MKLRHRQLAVAAAADVAVASAAASSFSLDSSEAIDLSVFFICFFIY
jgi:hypothetical protein